MTDNSYRAVRDLQHLQAIRVTQLVRFLQCPRAWSAEAFGEVPRQDNVFLRVGTAVHSVVESYLRHPQVPLTREWFNPHAAKLATLETKTKEIEAVWLYLRQLEGEGLRERVVAVEHRWHLELPSLKPLTGTVDLIARTADGGVLLVDHKTNRQAADEEWWRMQFQPLLYTLWARQAFPGVPIRFRIGYALLNVAVEWETDPEKDLAALTRFVEAQEEMRVYARTGYWPETPNDSCKYCPLRHGCQAVRGQFEEVANRHLAALRGEAPTTESPVREYVRLQRVSRLAGEMADELKDTIQARAMAEGGFEEAGHVVKVRTTRRRAVPFGRAHGYLQAVTDGERDQMDLDALYTVKVTEFDKLVRELGEEPPADLYEVTEGTALSITPTKPAA